MEKLKDLYLNDLIDRNTYEHDYLSFQEELRQAAAAAEPLLKPAGSKVLTDIQFLYSELSKSYKKEFWIRVVEKIIITNEDHFFVAPV